VFRLQRRCLRDGAVVVSASPSRAALRLSTTARLD
jgi:hypothetical protein